MRATACSYSIGACVGRGSVVGVGSVVGSGVGCVTGFGIGSVVGFGLGDGEGDVVTVVSLPLLSATRAPSPGKNKATKMVTAIGVKKNRASLAIHIGSVPAGGSGRSLHW